MAPKFGMQTAHRQGQWDRRRLQRGQSLIETLVFAMALLPLLLGMVFTVRYQNIRQATVAASRTVAFDCTVRPETCGSGDGPALQAETWQRHLSDSRTVLRSIASAERGVDPFAELKRNEFWVDRRQQPLLAATDAVQVAVVREPGTTTAKISELASGLPGHFGLPLADDLVRSEVQARVSSGRTLAQWLQRPQGLQLDLKGRTALLVDHWNAEQGAGEAQRSVASRVARGSVPNVPGFQALTDAGYFLIRTWIRSPLLRPFEPNGRDFNYHEVDVELVPDDRLGQRGGNGGDWSWGQQSPWNGVLP